MLSTTSEQTLNSLSKDLKTIQDKVYNGERINNEEGLLLFEKGTLTFSIKVSILALLVTV